MTIFGAFLLCVLVLLIFGIIVITSNPRPPIN